MKLIALLIAMGSLAACGPQVVNYAPEKRYPPVPTEEVRVLSSRTDACANAVELGFASRVTNQFMGNSTVQAMREEAGKMGANYVVVDIKSVNVFNDQKFSAIFIRCG